MAGMAKIGMVLLSITEIMGISSLFSTVYVKRWKQLLLTIQRRNLYCER